MAVFNRSLYNNARFLEFRFTWFVFTLFRGPSVLYSFRTGLSFVGRRISLAESLDILYISVDIALSRIDPDGLPERLLADPLDRLLLVGGQDDDLSKGQQGVPGRLGQRFLGLGLVPIGIGDADGRRDPSDIVFAETRGGISLVDEREAEVGIGVLFGKVSFDGVGRGLAASLGGVQGGPLFGPSSGSGAKSDEVHPVRRQVCNDTSRGNQYPSSTTFALTALQNPVRPPTFVALLDLPEKLHIDPADDRGSTPVTGKDDAFLPELVEKSGTDVIEEVVPMSVKVGVSVDLTSYIENAVQ